MYIHDILVSNSDTFTISRLLGKGMDHVHKYFLNKAHPKLTLLQYCTVLMLLGTVLILLGASHQ